MYQRHDERTCDAAVVAALYQRYAHIVLHYIHRSVASLEDTDDLVSEVFMVALDRSVWTDWNDAEQLAWLLRIARNKVVDYLRRRARHPAVKLDEAFDGLLATECRTPEQIVLYNEANMQLRLYVARLSSLQQEIVQLRFADNLQTKEIARILHRSDSVVRVLLSRSLNYLRRSYKASNAPKQL